MFCTNLPNIALASSLTYVQQLLQDNKGNVYVKGLSIRLAENEEEALNMLFEVFNHITK